jgi:dimethylargininase
VTIAGCLHLKSAVTAVAPETFLCNPAWVDGSLFGGVKTIHTDPSEPHAANALWLGDTILFPSAYSRTRDRLEREGLSTTPVPADELAKAEGGLTCCSLIFSI